MSALPSQIQLLKSALQNDKTPAAAWAVIDDYFTFFSKEDVDNDLWSLLVNALSSEQDGALKKACVRHDMIFFYEYTRLLMDAVRVFWEERKKGSYTLANYKLE